MLHRSQTVILRPYTYNNAAEYWQNNGKVVGGFSPPRKSDKKTYFKSFILATLSLLNYFWIQSGSTKF